MQLKTERGESDPEVEAATKLLNEYYSSPAYRAWYEEFQRRNAVAENQNNDKIETTEQTSKERPQIDVPLSADEALEKAVEEQRLGMPMAPESSDAKTKNGDAENTQNARKRKKKGPPEWYEVFNDYISCAW